MRQPCAHVSRSTKLTKLLVEFGVNWAGNGTIATVSSAATGEGVDGADFCEATLQGGVASLSGTPLGMAGAGGATALLRNRGMSELGKRDSQNAAGGVLGNVGGGATVDGVSRVTGRAKPEWMKNTVVNAAGGGVGGLGGVGMGAMTRHRLQSAGTPYVADRPASVTIFATSVGNERE